MKQNSFEFPKSSFLGMPKDAALIMEKILKNKNILKLMYYTSKDWKSKDDLTSAQIKSLFENNQVSLVPHVDVDPEKLTYLRMTFDNFSPNASNPEYRDNLIEFKIICHKSTWDLGDYELRPFRIAGEIDAMLNESRLSGIGVTKFLSAKVDVYDEEFSGVTISYWVVHGEEDKINPLS